MPAQPLPESLAMPDGWSRPAMASSSTCVRPLALMSARAGGVSRAPWEACNLGLHVQDAAEAVRQNRALFAQHLGAQPVWLQQVHGSRVLRLSAATLADMQGLDADENPPVADGAFTTEPGLGCVVMVADCLPLLLAAPEGRGVAALHAGWRGLAGVGPGSLAGSGSGVDGRGIVQSGVHALCEATSCDPADLAVWLGPCIGPLHFEVGVEVLHAFGVDPADASRPGRHPRFQPRLTEGSACRETSSEPVAASHAGKWLADLPGLARDALASLGVDHISGGEVCTVSDAARFFSYRRDGLTGRQAAGICLG